MALCALYTSSRCHAGGCQGVFKAGLYVSVCVQACASSNTMASACVRATDKGKKVAGMRIAPGSTKKLAWKLLPQRRNKVEIAMVLQMLLSMVIEGSGNDSHHYSQHLLQQKEYPQPKTRTHTHGGRLARHSPAHPPWHAPAPPPPAPARQTARGAPTLPALSGRQWGWRARRAPRAAAAATACCARRGCWHDAGGPCACVRACPCACVACACAFVLCCLRVACVCMSCVACALCV